jgi:mono/diheme cytochrome c family protein
MCAMSVRAAPGVLAATLCLTIAAGTAIAQEDNQRFGFGSAVGEAEIARVDIDVMPDGRGAPPGEGSYKQGKEVYEARCAACHGAELQGVKEAGGAPLIGGRGSLDSESPKKTVESYWPYASTLFDYTRRAMPFDAPGSLTDAEVYAVVAFILAEANIVDKAAMMNAEALASIEMPNRNGFIPDSRPDVYDYR